MFVTINGNELYVEVLGPDDAPTLITHHGAPGLSSHAETKLGYGALADEFQVVVYDARGCGRSEAKPPFTNAQWTDDLDALRQWLGRDQVFVAGGSYGGFIALEYGFRYPRHARALVLRDTAADGEHVTTGMEIALRSERTTIDPVFLRRCLDGGLTSDDDLRAMWRMLLPLYGYDYQPDEVEEQMRAASFRYETQNAALVNLKTYDIADRLPEIGCPTLITVGRHDWLTQPRYSERIAELVPDSRLEIFQASGHSPEVEEAAKFQRLVRAFLREANAAG